MTLLFAGIVAIFAFYCAFTLVKILLKPSRQWLEAEFLDDDLRAIEALENHREKIVQQLRDLELDYAMNKVSTSDYKSYKSRFEKQAVTIAKKIDQVMGGKSWGNRVDELLAEGVGREIGVDVVEGDLIVHSVAEGKIGESHLEGGGELKVDVGGGGDLEEGVVEGGMEMEGDVVESKIIGGLKGEKGSGGESKEDATEVEGNVVKGRTEVEGDVGEGEERQGLLCQCGSTMADGDNFCRVCGTSRASLLAKSEVV